MAFTRIGNVKLTHEQFANRVAWVKALLSGEYEQGRMRLHTTAGKWCCLGVVADCVKTPQREDLIRPDAHALLDGKWALDNLGLAGDPDGSPSVGGSSAEQLVATRWNDQDHFSFPQIADLVALATERKVQFMVIEHKAPELDDEDAGEFARNWLSQHV